MAPPPRRGSNDQTRTLLLIAAVVAVVAVLGVVVALVVGGGDDDERRGRASVEPVPTRCRRRAANRPAATFKPVRSGDVPTLDDPCRSDRPVSGASSGYDYDGNETTIDPATDGPTMVVLLAHWCPHCNAEIPVLNEWRDSGEIPDGPEHRRREHWGVAGRPELPARRVARREGLAVAGARRRRPPDADSPPRRWAPTAARRTRRWCSSTPTGWCVERLSGEVPIDVIAPLADELVAGSS